ncbi:Insect cuticle protein [Popillia japonica]|uniref:Insect cuticle protein n=1 Tax=Popillia japonica TaxID=7064 RepID=A0AAW1N1A1_POPJA
MKTFVALFLAVAVAHAKPSGVLETVVVPVASVATQYHAQDSTGQYTYGYSNPLSSKAEVRSLDGAIKGAYNYLDGEGKVQSVSYSADAKTGFHLTSATNLPQAPAVPELPKLILPVPVEDTKEVVEARAKHLDAFKEAETRSSAEPATVTTTIETTLPSLKVTTPALATLSTVRAAPILSYNYGIPGATVTYSTYSAPLLTYNSVFTTPFLHPALPVPALPAVSLLPGLPGASQQQQGQVDVQNDSVTVEAKESKEKSD